MTKKPQLLAMNRVNHFAKRKVELKEYLPEPVDPNLERLKKRIKENKRRQEAEGKNKKYEPQDSSENGSSGTKRPPASSKVLDFDL